MQKVTITAIHKDDAFYPLRDEMIGVTGIVQGRIVSTGDKWYNLTIKTYRGEEITFAYCQFEKVG